MPNSQILFQLLAVIVVVFYISIFWSLSLNKDESDINSYTVLRDEISRLEKHLKDSENDIKIIRNQLSGQQDTYKSLEVVRSGRYRGAKIDVKTESVTTEKVFNIWPHPIPVLVFACQRANALSNHLNKLLKYRTSATKFPIIVSQDCDDKRVAAVAQSFGSSVQYVKHLSGGKANVTAAPRFERYLTYYMIARHYKLGLSYVFDKLDYTSVIITEDDLDIAPDFFEYFSATRYLLDKDPTLYCVSAWNDNGKPNLIDMSRSDLLYRSDFFPGLGWMMTRALWQELAPIWPPGFWDDWIRDPDRRKNRSCIRPEISRTSMTNEGKKGASNGLFFVKHLAKIVLNTQPTNFTNRNLDYLLKAKYDPQFLQHVYSTPVLTLSELKAVLSQGRRDADDVEYRVQYVTLNSYLEIAAQLQIMNDFKAGVPRTAYHGIVTCYVNNIRIYVAPDRNVWKQYDPSWEAPNTINN